MFSLILRLYSIFTIYPTNIVSCEVTEVPIVVTAVVISSENDNIIDDIPVSILVNEPIHEAYELYINNNNHHSLYNKFIVTNTTLFLFIIDVVSMLYINTEIKWLFIIDIYIIFSTYFFYMIKYNKKIFDIIFRFLFILKTFIYPVTLGFYLWLNTSLLNKNGFISIIINIIMCAIVFFGFIFI
jgi:hypothetical protein